MLGVLLQGRLEVFGYRRELAAGRFGQPKDSASAARFLEDICAEPRATVNAQALDGPSEAAKVLEKVRSRVVARPTTVTEEILG